MSQSTKKRTLDAFFKPPPKKIRVSDDVDSNEAGTATSKEEVNDRQGFSTHPTYPFPILNLPGSISKDLISLPSTIGKTINEQPHLDLLYFEPYIPKYLERDIFQFLRKELPFYRVEYTIKRSGTETHIRTPRYTTVFGLDSTSLFSPSGSIIDAKTNQPVKNDKNYTKIPPRPLPKCLDDLRLSTEAATGCKFNFCLVNYYASGSDSISYHSDDERFLGVEPAIASFSLGARRDFLMKHKPVAPNDAALKETEKETDTKPLKLELKSGDMILMRGTTQANWLHSIPKRTGKNANDGGRINITFRKALVRGGTENYYHYNVGTGPVYRWDSGAREMKIWKPQI